MSTETGLAPVSEKASELTLAVVGNPNTGKSSLFNALTGIHQQVGNYPGITVERKHGNYTYGGARVTVVDLPGTYSLVPASQDERAQLSDAEAERRLRQVLKEAGLDGENAPGKAIRERFKDVKFFAGSKYSLAGLKRLGAAVRKGSWLMSSDWAVLALERALPGTVRWTGHTTYEETVEVIPGMTGKRHSLMKGVFGKPAKARWWLETEAYLFAVKGKHKRLVESRQLAARYHGNKNIAVLLEPGKGRVLHALSHGWLQSGREDDMAVMQRLMLNFLTEKSIQNWRRAREKKKN